MNSNSNDIFIDVRKSYRLLHDYQRMVLDVLKFIGEQLEIPYSGGWCKYSDAAPRNGKGYLDNWAWDWLGLIFYEFQFVKEEQDGTFLRLAALHMPDTGALQSRDKVNTASFPPVDESKSLITFIFSRSDWDMSFLDDVEKRAKFIEEGILPSSCTEIGMLSYTVDIEELTTEVNAREQVKLIRKKFSLPQNAETKQGGKKLEE